MEFNTTTDCLPLFKRSLNKPSYEFWLKEGYLNSTNSKKINKKIAETFSRYAEWSIENYDDKYSYILSVILLSLFKICPKENVIDFEKLMDFVKEHYTENFGHFENVAKHTDEDAVVEWTIDCMKDIVSIVNKSNNEKTEA